jgi:ABC-type glycerol-3-phosphate transport system substrate-binding protein
MLVKHLAGAALLAGSLAVSGCATSSTSSDDPSEDGSSAGGEPVTLKFQTLAFQAPTIKASKDIVASWNEENPDVQVDYVQGSWDSVQDQLVTQFQGGTAPDIIHYESAAIMSFAEQGYLADLTDSLSDEVKASVSDDVWGTVTSSDGAIIAAPTLMQSYVVFANADALEDAGVAVPTGDTMTWDEFEDIARATTGDDKYGVAWGLKSPTATVMNMALNFGGTFFEGTGEDATINVTDAELEVPRRIHSMAYEDKSIDPVSLTQSGTDALPGFFGGTSAMFFGGNFYAQQITESAPEGFNWVVLPPLEGSEGTAQAANPQTLSVPAESKNVDAAAEFINFFLNAENQAALAQGDWLIPASAEARDLVASETGGESGWDVILKSGESLTVAPFQSASGYVQWRDQVATPALQQYFADEISLEDLQSQLQEGYTP